jgi:amino acid adenylation domain-containing protein
MEQMTEQIIEGFQLSVQQQRLWAAQQSARVALPARCALRCSGPLQAELLQRAAQRVIERHEALRTTFCSLSETESPIQVIGESSRPSWSEIDLTELQPQEQQKRLDALFEEAAPVSYDESATPFQLTLLKLSASEHVLLLSLPALSADTATLNNLTSELVAFYADGDDAAQVAEEATQYVDFSAWQDELLAEESAEAQRLFELPDSFNLSLPPQFKEAVGAGFEPASVSLRMGRDLYAKVCEQARNLNTNPANLFLGCWVSLLSRLTGQREITVGRIFAGRKYENLRNAAGLYAKCLPVTARFEADTRFTNILGQVEDAVTDLDSRVEYLAPGYAGAAQAEPQQSQPSLHTAFFDACFEFTERPDAYRAGETLIEVLRQSCELERYRLKLDCVGLPDDFQLELRYDRQAVNEADAARLAERFLLLVESVLNDAETRVAELSILPEAEERRLVYELNETATAYPNDLCIHQLFEAQAKRTPDRVAISSPDERLTYRELNERASLLAHSLRARGVGPEVVVGILMRRTPAMVVSVLAILKAGGAYLPLDPEYPQQRLSYMAADAGVKLILSQRGLAESVMVEAAAVEVLCVDDELDLRGDDTVPELEPIGGEQLAYVIYTSGSTGRPKGVMIEHRGARNLAEAQIRAFQIQADSRVLQFASPSFDASVSEIFTTLFSGATLVMGAPTSLLSGQTLQQLLKEEAVTTVTLPPSVLATLSTTELPALRTMVVGGEACPTELAARWAGAGHRFLNAYGPTEMTVCATIAECAADGSKPPIGRAIANTQVYVLDAHLRPVPEGVAGDLYTSGAGIARGYLGQPEMTALKFIPNPFSLEAGARLYRTGDLARFLPDGSLDYLGRVDEQVKLRGFRIEPGEIETVLMQTSGAREAVVVAREDARGDKRLVAYLVIEAGRQKPSTGELRSQLRARLPEYMLPSTFVILDRMPLTPNGKIDRKALPEPDQLRPELESVYVAPATESESLIARIWQDVLQLERVGVHDNFFDLGGHSLLMLDVRSRLSDTFQKEIQINEMFEYPTIRALAEFLDPNASAGSSAPQLDERDEKLRAGQDRLRQQLQQRLQAKNN